MTARDLRLWHTGDLFGGRVIRGNVAMVPHMFVKAVGHKTGDTQAWIEDPPWSKRFLECRFGLLLECSETYSMIFCIP